MTNNLMINKQPIIQFDNVYFNYSESVPILKGINFNIYPNEYVCIIGHNGSGKSTISKVLVGLLKPLKGQVKIFDKIINSSNLKEIRNNIGIVFQNPDNQFVGLAVEDDIAFGLENRKVDPKEMQPIINLASKAIGIEDLLQKSPEDLSGGQKQKVAIAGILAINPEIMIFDESTSMLDPKGKNELKSIMKSLVDNANKTIISITHDMEEVLIADRVIILENGKIVCEGTPKDIFLNNPNIESLKLDFPFIYKLSKLLSQNPKLNITPTLDVKNFISQICQKKV